MLRPSVIPFARVVLIALAAVLVIPGDALNAQALAPEPPRSTCREAPTSRLVAGGTVGWAAGLASGAALGYALSGSSGEGYFGPSEMWLGAWIGSAVGTAAGVHLAGCRRGSVTISALAAVAAAPLSVLLVGRLTHPGIPVLVAIPVAQIGVAVTVERLTARIRRQ
ncbi:hypothetical protein BH23GEM9_BH23GEM9_34350 [soil metagenome]